MQETKVLLVCITPFGDPVVPEVNMSTARSSGFKGDAPLGMLRPESSTSACKKFSKLLDPEPPTTTTWAKSGKSWRIPSTIFSKSKSRYFLGIKRTFDLAKLIMYVNSRSRKMCINGFITAPIRPQASVMTTNSHQLGNWTETTSPCLTPIPYSDCAAKLIFSDS